MHIHIVHTYLWYVLVWFTEISLNYISYILTWGTTSPTFTTLLLKQGYIYIHVCISHSFIFFHFHSSSAAGANAVTLRPTEFVCVCIYLSIFSIWLFCLLKQLHCSWYGSVLISLLLTFSLTLTMKETAEMVMNK